MRLGFLVSSLGASQLAYDLLTQGRRHLNQRRDLDMIVFYQNIVKALITPTFGMMNISEAFGFTGVAIATDLATAEQLKHMPGPQARYFYVWDLEWIASGDDYERFANVYCDTSLPRLARSTKHAEIIEQDWNRPVRAIVEDFNITQLTAVVTNDGKG